MGHFARECRAPRSKDNRNWNQGSSSKAVRIEDASEKAMCAIDGAGFDWSDMAEEEIQANMALMAFSDSEEIALLKRIIGHKEYLMGLLRTELENVKKENEGFEFKIAKFEKSSKDLDDLLASQITDKSKKGFGYNVVPSPHPLILNRPTPLDLSYSGLEEFKQPEVNEYGPRDSSVKPTTGCDKESDNSKENTDDSLKQQQKTDSSSVKSPLKVDKDWKEKFFCPANQVREEEPKKARENNDAPIIEDWVLDDEDDVESIHKVEKKTVIPTATKKEFVKPEKTVRRSVRSVNTARPFSTARSFNTVRPSYTAHPKSIVHCARPRTYFQNQAQSTVQRPFYKRTALTLKHVGFGNRPDLMVHHLFSTNIITLIHEADFPKSMESSRHMSGETFSHLSVFKRFVEVMLTFVEEQMLPDENQILLKIPRQDSMYSFDMKNIVPKDGLTCLVAKATSEKSNAWHRRQATQSRSCRPKAFNPSTKYLVLIVKPHTKTPYEHFRGIKPAIGFMKPFGCHVTILNTLDKLGKFDGKNDEENKPMIEGNGPKWLFDLDSLTQSMNYVPVVAGKSSNDFAGIQGDASYFDDASPRSVADAHIQDKDELHDEVDATEESHDGSSLQNLEVSIALPEVILLLLNTWGGRDPSPASEDSHRGGPRIEMGNTPQSYESPYNHHTSNYKDHPLACEFGDEEPKRVLKLLEIQHGVRSIARRNFFSSNLTKYNYTDVKSASTPTDLEKPLVQDGDAAEVDEHLYRSMIGSLMYLTASRPDIIYLKGKPSLGLWYSKDSPLELVAYTDSDYAGASQDKKSTTGGCRFLGNRLISWQCKKQTVVATSIIEAEYVAAANCCGQFLWIQNQLLDYGYNFMNTVIYIDNTSTICIIENHVQYSKTKHIEIRHHFIRDCNAKKLIQMAKIDTEHNVVDLLTKGFNAGRFQYLVSSIGILNP
ncbi:hypothetical protein Tco_0986223 [Tanacetum coccineum]